MAVFSKIVIRAKGRGNFKGVKLKRTCPVLTYLYFADDVFFFFRTSPSNALELKSIINVFCFALGQTVNLEKSGLFFIMNTQDMDKVIVQEYFHVT